MDRQEKANGVVGDLLLTMILILLSALLFCLAFPNNIFLYGFWPAAWFFSTPLFFVFERKGFFARLGLAVVFTLVAHAVALSWFVFYNKVGYFLLVGVLSLQVVIFAIFYPPANIPFKLRILYVPVAWVASEYLRTLILGGASVTLGHSQAFNLPAVQMASVLGASGLSFVLILFGYLVYGFLSGRMKGWPVILALGVIPWGLFVFGATALSRGGSALSGAQAVSVLTIQPQVSPDQKMSPTYFDKEFDDIFHLTEKGLAKTSPGLVIWPETAVPTTFLCDPELKEKIFSFVNGKKNVFVFGTIVADQAKYYNAAVLLDPLRKASSYCYKQYLVPLTEHLPPGRVWAFLDEKAGAARFNFTRGAKTKPFVFVDPGTEQKARFGVLFCSEEGQDGLVREYVDRGAGFLVTLMNDGWFHAAPAFVQHAQFAVMQAVSYRRPIIRAANSGWSCLVDPYGRVSPRFSRDESPRFFLHHVTPVYRKSFYYIVGDGFSALCFFLVIMCAFGSFVDRREKGE